MVFLYYTYDIYMKFDGIRERVCARLTRGDDCGAPMNFVLRQQSCGQLPHFRLEILAKAWRLPHAQSPCNPIFPQQKISMLRIKFAAYHTVWLAVV